MVRKFVLIIFIGLLLGAYFPPEFVREYEREMAIQAMKDGKPDQALVVFNILRFQRDPVGINNYYALLYHNATNEPIDEKKQVRAQAELAWREAAASGVGAAAWNLAMLHIKYGRQDRWHDDIATRRLKEAQELGVEDASKLLSTGKGDLSRIKVLVDMGDRGAAMDWASKMHYRGNQAQKIRALKIAANSGSVAAMADLGAELRQKKHSPNHKVKKWLVKAAEMGSITAARRLGDCYNFQRDFCRSRDAQRAAFWYEKALGPVVYFTPPQIMFDDEHVLRLGSKPRWYRKPHNVQKSAAYELGRLYMIGDGIEKDRARAIMLFQRAGGWKDARELVNVLSR